MIKIMKHFAKTFYTIIGNYVILFLGSQIQFAESAFSDQVNIVSSISATSLALR